METIIVPIVIAIISGPIVVIMSKLRSENSSQHAEARSLLRDIGGKVDNVASKLDKHIGWHDGKEGK